MLLPKVTSPELVSQFQPIAMCNVLVKIVTKVIANKLKYLMGKLTLENQSSFVPG